MVLKTLLGVLLLVCCATAQELFVTINDGDALGYISAQGTHKVWHLPYGAPPIGANRWKSPQPPTPWGNQTYNASAMPPMCPQTGFFSRFYPTSEDCLYLFVYVPINHTTNDLPLPVQIFIHGGSFTGGGGQLYTGDIAPKNEFIYVSISYRLGTLGFFSHPSLLSYDEHKDGAGFYGIQDQRLALKWVQNNIQFFGGDKTKVTISGESAGAGSVCFHIASPRSAGLFQKAIMQSAGCNMAELATETANSISLATQFGCSGTEAEILTCLMNVDVDTILNGTRASQPTTIEIPEQPYTIIARGEGARVPLLIGTNRDEGTFAVCPDPTLNNMTNDDYAAVLQREYPAFASLILQIYPASSYGTATQAFANVLSDYLIKCPAKLLADVFSYYPESPVFMFDFNHVPSYLTIDSVVQQLLSSPIVTASCLGVTHTYDIAMQFTFFDIIVAPLNLSLSSEELVLRETMRRAWSSFIVNGVPEFPGLSWPIYNVEEAPYVELALNSTIGVGFRQATCNLWNSAIPINTTGSSTTTTTTSDSTTSSSTSPSSSTTTGEPDGSSSASFSFSSPFYLFCLLAALLFMDI